MFTVVERQSSSTSTDSGLHLQEKIKGLGSHLFKTLFYKYQ